MSGHSKWSTIKRQKESTDQARGKLFSKLSKAISIAVKTGGSDNPDFNPKLRMAVEQAKTANMPKANIERAIDRASDAKNLEEVVYEGFGPEGIGIVIEATTDNRNRTAQELKTIFDRSGGNMGGPNSVMFNFSRMGGIVVKKKPASDEQILKFIDLGAEDVEEGESSLFLYVPFENINKIREELESDSEEIESVSIVLKPKTKMKISDDALQTKIESLLGKLTDHDDVQQVFSTLEY